MKEEEKEVEEFQEEEEDEFTSRKRDSYGGKKEDINYDKDTEFADILGDCLDNPEKAQKKMEERLRKKRNKILHTKTGSTTSMQITFNNPPFEAESQKDTFKRIVKIDLSFPDNTKCLCRS
ncbi:unnamed protein product [Eruca vesicaria subsp. sativa]|uniref:Uncharacterized protein n=1 Tax=Eruca vesicaria subsp. sativa TaxID=29727 RepID=A0ABC8MA28_ERUVS|nr:unnamed protein product [Eruca vesicaria subsp. sativa]